MVSQSEVRVTRNISCQQYIVWLSKMSGNAANPSFFNTKDWPSKTLANPPHLLRQITSHVCPTPIPLKVDAICVATLRPMPH